jgi:F5/8 type C domain
VNNGISMFVYAGWLNNAMQMPSDVRSTLDFYGITPDKYATLLHADPLFTGIAPNQTMDANRFAFIGTFPYQPPFGQGDQASSQSYSIDQKSTETSTLAFDDSYSVGLSASGGFNVGVFSSKLSISSTWTWTNSSTFKNSNGTGMTDSFTIGQPAFGYSGPTLLRAYVDKIYHTYAFTLDFPQGETNLALGRPSWQSSDTGWGAVAALANDGNTDGNFWDGSVNHTDAGFSGGGEGWPGQFWYVDLGSERVVNSVRIFNRTDCCSERLSHYNILAWDSMQGVWKVVADHSADDTSGIGFFNLPVAMVKTQYVMLAKTDDNYLHVAEVEVMGF